MEGAGEEAAGAVAEGDNEHSQHGRAAPEPGEPEVEHVRHAVLRSGEYEAHHAEEEHEVLPQLVRAALVALDRYVDEDVAQHAEEKEADEPVAELHLAERRRALREAGDARHAREHGGYARADEVAQPDDRQRQGVFAVVLKGVADAAGVEAEAEGADCVEPYGEERRADDAALHREVHQAAEADAHACKGRGDEISQRRHLTARSPRPRG